VGAGEGGVLMRAKAAPIQTEKACPSPKVTMLNLALLLAFLIYTASLNAQAPGAFIPAGNMTTPRVGHTATLLMDGKVLITGGNIPGPGGGQVLSSAELYDPSTGGFTATGNMTTPRRIGHTATILPDGRVLIAGGYGAGNSVIASAELYDPSTGVFTPTGDMIEPRGGHSAILLATGKVLIVGGYGNYPNVGDAELYDPDTGTFAQTGSYAAPVGCDFCAPSVLLADGRVLFPSQAYAPQLYNPATGTFSITGPMSGDCNSALLSNGCDSAAILLTNGKVLFAGGESDFGRSAYAELYDPATGRFAATGSMTARRAWHSLTLLPDATVLAAGGETDGCSGNFCAFAGSVMSAELYDLTSGTWAATGDMTGPRSTHTATLLSDGRVLIAGGVSYGGIGVFYGATGSAELYVPSSLIPIQVVTDLRFDRTTIAAGASYSVNVSGSNLTPQTFFDVRFIAPGHTLSDVILNWQRGVTADHAVLAGTASGIWRITGVRAHQIETDHTGNFVPVSATITVSP
jgi:Kelch motif protein/galactose oxidase-like protein